MRMQASKRLSTPAHPWLTGHLERRTGTPPLRDETRHPPGTERAAGNQITCQVIRADGLGLSRKPSGEDHADARLQGGAGDGGPLIVLAGAGDGAGTGPSPQMKVAYGTGRWFGG